MNDKLKIAVLILSVVLGFALSACHREKINFYRESKVQQTLSELDNLQHKKDTIKKSSGIIIYKDNSYQNNSINNKPVNFGPKDIDFNVKFRY